MSRRRVPERYSLSYGSDKRQMAQAEVVRFRTLLSLWSELSGTQLIDGRGFRTGRVAL